MLKERPMAPDEDPVQRASTDDADLYDVATWDDRTALDHLAVRVHAGLVTARTVAIVLLALALFLGLFGLAIPVVADEPVLGALGLVSTLPAFVLVGYLWYDDPTRREPIEPLAITFVLAVLFATFAAIVNEVFAAGFVALPVGMALYFFLVVGPVEETVKWLAVRIHAYGRDDFDAVVDGVVYGAVAGLGFAAIENLIYILVTYLEATDVSATLQFRYATQTAIGRAFVGPGHVIFSAYAGYYLGLAKFNPGKRGPIVVKGLLVAALAHATYNTIVTYVPQLGIDFGGLLFFGFVLVYQGVFFYILYRKLKRYETAYERAHDGPKQATEFEVETTEFDPDTR